MFRLFFCHIIFIIINIQNVGCFRDSSDFCPKSRQYSYTHKSFLAVTLHKCIDEKIFKHSKLVLCFYVIIKEKVAVGEMKDCE
jgi:hypothetical protein